VQITDEVGEVVSRAVYKFCSDVWSSYVM